MTKNGQEYKQWYTKHCTDWLSNTNPTKNCTEHWLSNTNPTKNCTGNGLSNTNPTKNYTEHWLSNTNPTKNRGEREEVPVLIISPVVLFLLQTQW
jgi:hypothetical protein